MTARDATVLAALSALWGSSYLLMHFGAADFGPLPLAALRASVAALLLAPWALRPAHRAALAAHAGPVALVGLANAALPFVCFAYAATRLPSGLAAVLGAVTPLLGALIGQVLGDERLPRRAWAGLVLGWAGVAGLALARGRAAPAGGGPTVLAMCACLLAALGYAVAAQVARRRLAGVPPAALAGGSQAVAALVLLPLGGLAWPAVAPRPVAWACALALAAACTALAYALFFGLVRRVGATRTLTVGYLIPLWALALGAAVLGESLDAGLAAAALAILGGTALAQSRPAGRAATLRPCASPAVPPLRRAWRRRWQPWWPCRPGRSPSTPAPTSTPT